MSHANRLPKACDYWTVTFVADVAVHFSIALQAAAAEALLDAEMELTVDDDGASEEVAAEFESVLMEIDAAR